MDMSHVQSESGPSILVAPGGTLGAFNELLRQPEAAVTRAAQGAGAGASRRLLVGSVLAYILYGAVAGLFQGGAQVAIAALKVPLIILASLVLCAPSFYVFGTLAGAELSGRRFLGLMAGFGGMLALILMGLLPVAWLFTVSSSSLLFVVFVQVLVWSVALAFAFRFLLSAMAEPRARGALVLWILLFAIVSCQFTTYIRPVLWREPGAPMVETGKLFFLEHLAEVAKSSGR
jgi:hypothetical protein